MSYTLLQLVDQVHGELGLSEPSLVIGSAQLQTKQFLGLVQRLGKDLVREHEWRRLVRAQTVETRASITKTGTTASGSASITGLPNTTSLQVGDVVSGTGIPQYSEILSLDGATEISLDTTATASGTVTLTFMRQDYGTLAGQLETVVDRFISDTLWDRTNYDRVRGSESSQRWQAMKNGIAVASTPPYKFRAHQGGIRVFPPPTTLNRWVFEYVSKLWVVASGADLATKEKFTLDTDTCIFPDDLMAAGLKYYFLKAKKLDFGVEMAEYMEILSARKAQDVPAKTLYVTHPAGDPVLIGNIAEGNWDID